MDILDRFVFCSLSCFTSTSILLQDHNKASTYALADLAMPVSSISRIFYCWQYLGVDIYMLVDD